MSDYNITVVSLGALTNGTTKLFSAPTDANGGGITVLRAMVRESLAAGTTASSLRLLKGTNAGGTFAVNGTLDAAAVGGTASAFVTEIDQEWTLSSGWVDGGEALAVIESNVQAAATVTRVEIHWVMGR